MTARWQASWKRPNIWTPRAICTRCAARSTASAHRRSHFPRPPGLDGHPLGAAFAAGDSAAILDNDERLCAAPPQQAPLNFPVRRSTFKRPEGHFAGQLIEQAGLKGVSVGAAQVSEKHAGFLINRGGATCDDMLRLIELVQERVRKQFGVELECEVRIVK